MLFTLYVCECNHKNLHRIIRQGWVKGTFDKAVAKKERQRLHGKKRLDEKVAMLGSGNNRRE